jgi:hypothetical protein
LENLDLVREIMNLANQEFQATGDQYQTPARKGIDSDGLDRYVRLVFGLRDRSAGNEKSHEQIVPAVVELSENGRGSNLAGETYWGAYNAVTEYLNYFRGKTQDNTLDSLWYGIAPWSTGIRLK